MNTMTVKVEIELPEGVAVDTYEFNREHDKGVAGDMYGSWGFRPEDVPDYDIDNVIFLNGTLQDVVDQLEAGRYILCP